MKPVTNTALQTATGRTRMLLALALVLVLATLLLAAAMPAVPALAQEGVVVDEEKAAQEEGAAQERGDEKEGVAKEEGAAKEGATKREATREGANQGGGPATATGVLGRAAPHSPDPTPVYAITDEATGKAYELVSGFVDLEQYVGERVTIQGAPVPGPGDPSKPPLLNVTQIDPADGTGDGGDDDGPVTCQSLDCPKPGDPNDKATLSFELTVFGDPPADAAFFGNVHTGEGGPGRYVPLTDPDEDRVYTGSTTVDRFGPGPRPVPPGVEPVSFPVRIVQDYSEVIKDFGTVKLDGDKTFEAEVSFPVDDCPIISPTPEQCGDGGSGGGDGGGSGSGGSGSGGSDDGSSGSGSSGGSSGVGSGSGSGLIGGVTNGVRGVLPSTGGGAALWVLGAGALMASVGFLVRRFAR